PPLISPLVTDLFFDSMRSGTSGWNARVFTGPAGPSSITSEAYCAPGGNLPVEADASGQPSGLDGDTGTATANCPPGPPAPPRGRHHRAGRRLRTAGQHGDELLLRRLVTTGRRRLAGHRLARRQRSGGGARRGRLLRLVRRQPVVPLAEHPERRPEALLGVLG